MLLKAVPTLLAFFSLSAFAATPTPPPQSLKPIAAEFGKAKTVGELLTTYKTQLDQRSYAFLAKKLKGFEGVHFSFTDVGESKLVLKIDHDLVPVEFPNIKAGRLKPMLVNHHQVLAEDAPTPRTDELYTLILNALPEYASYSFFLPQAQAASHSGVVMAGIFSGIVRWLGGTCGTGMIAYDQGFCDKFGKDWSSFDGRLTGAPVRVTEAVMIERAEAVCSRNQLVECEGDEDVKKELSKLAQCFQNLVDQHKMNLPAKFRPCLGLKPIAGEGGATAPSETSK